MRAMRKYGALAGLAAAGLLAFSSCAALNEMAAALANIQRLRFKVGDVRGLRLAGVDVGGRARLSQFSALDALALVNAFRSRRLRMDLVLEVLAVNPNDGTGGTARTVSTLTSLECRLLIDGKPTVTGDIENPVEIPGTGEQSVIPIRVSLDLLEFFGDKRYEDLVDLALAIGGANRDPLRLSLDAQPRVTTPLGVMTYPGRLTIVSNEFR